MITTDKIDAAADVALNQKVVGHIKLWEVNPETGEKTLLVEKNNLIVNQGADILANAMAGTPNSAISHFYINYASTSPSLVSPTSTDTIASFASDGTHGYVRIPLAFSPALTNDGSGNYVSNVVYFTSFLTNGGNFTTSGLAFTNGVYLYALGLINGGANSNGSLDRLFSKTTFGPITWNAANGLAISWGVTFNTV